MVAHRKILIVGSGIGGLTAALSLAQSNQHVELYEKEPQLFSTGAGIQLSPNAMAVFAQLGIADTIQQVAVEPDALTMRHYRSGKYYFTTPIKHYAHMRYGAPYLHIHRADLQRILYRHCLHRGVAIYFNHPFTRYSPTHNGISVEFSHDQHAEGDLLIGADGIHSSVCRQIFPHHSTAQYSGYAAWRGMVAAEHMNTHLIERTATVWAGQNSHVVIYYVCGGKWINCVVVTAIPYDAIAHNQQQQLPYTFSSWHPAVQEILSRSDDFNLWYLFDRPSPPQWFAKRAVLIGDACHPILPFMAQGAAMAIEDAFILSHLIAHHSAQWDACFTQYEKIRRGRVERVRRRSANNGTTFHLNSGWRGIVKRHVAQALHAAPHQIHRANDWLYGYRFTPPVT